MRHSSAIAHSPTNRRLQFLALGLFLFGLILVGRLASLQLWGAEELKAGALAQQRTVRVLPAERGKIFYGERKSSELYPLATNRVYNHLYAAPRDIKNASSTVAALLPLLNSYGLSAEVVAARVGRDNDIYEPLLHRLTDEELSPFMSLGLAGISSERETWRFYPEGETLAHIIGFVGLAGEERVGQYGLEGYYEDELRGEDGRVEGDVDITGRLIQTGELARRESVAGADIILTVDRVLQNYACARLRLQAEKLGAAGGDLIIMDPGSGAILAMCSTPAFDPNFYNKVEDISVYINSSVSLGYEPGSIFKPITLAAAIDAGAVDPLTTYVDTGTVKFGAFTIKNSDNEAHGETSMVQVLEKSLNTGAIFAEQQLGNDKFRQYVERFGFGKLTGLALGQEAGGNLKLLSSGRDINFATASFGQGITVTPLQMVAAYGALANGGKLLRPYIVKEMRQGDKALVRGETKITGEPISPRTSTILSGMLVSVVRSGHAKRAAVAGYRLGAKTGTAQVAEGGEYGAKTIHSVVGFGPIDKPAFVMIVKLNDPKAGRFAESTAVPVFGEVARFLLQYYEIPPDEER